ncbi:MAG: acyl carrier protein [Holophaga sp.]|nr:acyl carrier protein [Holophaga sp.]
MSLEITPLEMKKFIIETLALEDTQPEDIGDDEPLFIEGLGLDSIDGLELDIALRKKFQIEVSEEKPANREHLATVRSLIAFVAEKSQSPA